MSCIHYMTTTKFSFSVSLKDLKLKDTNTLCSNIFNRNCQLTIASIHVVKQPFQLTTIS